MTVTTLTVALPLTNYYFVCVRIGIAEYLYTIPLVLHAANFELPKIIVSKLNWFELGMPFLSRLTHRGWVTHISVSKLTIIGEFVFISNVPLMMSANSRIRFGLQTVFVCLYITPSHYHHCANFIWRHWTYKMPVRYNLSSVWVRLSIFSQLSIIQYLGLCVFSLPISFVMIESIYIPCLIIIIKSKVWTITHC